MKVIHLWGNLIVRRLARPLAWSAHCLALCKLKPTEFLGGAQNLNKTMNYWYMIQITENLISYASIWGLDLDSRPLPGLRRKDSENFQTYCPVFISHSALCFPSVVCWSVAHHLHMSWLKIYYSHFPGCFGLSGRCSCSFSSWVPSWVDMAGGPISLDGVREPHQGGWEWVLIRWGGSVVLRRVLLPRRLIWLPHMADSGQRSKAVEAGGSYKACKVYILEVTLQYSNFFSRDRSRMKGCRNWLKLLMG